MAEKDRNETIQTLARERLKLSGGALSHDDAIAVATSQVEADEAAAATEKKTKGQKAEKPEKPEKAEKPDKAEKAEKAEKD